MGLGGVTWLQTCQDGRWVALASATRVAKVWDANTTRPVCDPVPHPTRVMQVQFSPDARWLATVSEDEIVRLWELCPAVPGQSLECLADIAAAFACKKMRWGTNKQAGVADPAVLLREVRAHYANNPDAQKLIDWFSMTKDKRTISPLSPMKLSR